MSKRVGIWVLTTVGALIGAYGGWEMTRYMGRDAIRFVAKEHNLCMFPSCEEGIASVATVVGEKFKISHGMVEYCVGVDDWAKTKVHRGGWIKVPLIYAMYMPCGELAS